MSPDAPRPHAAYWPRRLPRELAIPATTLWFNLEVAAARYPDKAAYVFCGATLTYRELKQQAERLAGWLQQAGVARGDRVALYLQNCPQFVIAFYAVMRADAVVVPVNPMNRADEFEHYIADPDTRGRHLRGRPRRVRRHRPTPRCRPTSACAACS